MADEMSEQAETAADAEDTESTPEPAPEQDWFLMELIDFAERGVELDIVLTVGGSHLAGRLVGGRRYFENLAEKMRSATGAVDPVIPETMGKLFEAHASAYPKVAEANQRPLGEDRYGFVHLLNARWRAPTGQAFPNNGTSWRGRLSKIEGFWLGKLDSPN